MKHSISITIYLAALFLVSQIVGLAVINQYIDHAKTSESGTAEFTSLPYNIERPQVNATFSFTFIFIAIIVGTALMFLLIRYKKVRFWKLWYLLSVVVTLSIAFSAFIQSTLAFFIAAIIAYIKVYKPNVIVHNASEVFIYGGLAAIFVPVMNIIAIFALLFLISLYDMYAVWKSKHMVKLAKFQTSSKVFAGLALPYPKIDSQKQDIKQEKKIIQKQPLKQIKTGRKIAILGGGDIGFPLIFAGVVMKELMVLYPVAKGFLLSLIVPIVCVIALAILFVKGKPQKFYPAMPFLSIACLVGFVILKVFNVL